MFNEDKYRITIPYNHQSPSYSYRSSFNFNNRKIRELDTITNGSLVPSNIKHQRLHARFFHRNSSTLILNKIQSKPFNNWLDTVTYFDHID